MIVVGGIYRETCDEPYSDTLFGSGLRASFAISRGCTNLQLFGTAYQQETDHVRQVSEEFGFQTNLAERPYPIRFHYSVPLDSPRLLAQYLPGTEAQSIQCEGDSVLVFGMIEAKAEIHAKNLVVDPQGLVGLDDRISWTAEKVAVVGNRTEIARLAKEDHNASADLCVAKLLALLSVDVVVAKCGARGATIADASGVSQVGAFQTNRVDPIGSGDVFSAVFAFYWAECGYPATESARLASRATASWVSKGPFQVVDANGEVVAPDIDREVIGEAASVYVAAPFFTVGQRWLLGLCRDAISDLGACPFSPLHDVGIGAAEVVAPADIEGLRNAGSVLALLDDPDSGTTFEVGYACALGIPVVGFLSQQKDHDLTMLTGSGVNIFNDLSTSVYNAIWQTLTPA